GIRLKSNSSRGGVVEKLWYQDIRMEDISKEAIRINTNYGSYMKSRSGKAYPVFRDITIKNVTCNGAKMAVSIQGTNRKPVENITLENVSIKARTGMKFTWVNGLRLKNVTSKPLQGRPIIFENCKDVVNE
ncbi:unnamed protein product, partial [marine sediment metagenome]